jgi:hypothetical protein
MPPYSWNTVKVGVKHQSIYQSINQYVRDGNWQPSNNWNIAKSDLRMWLRKNEIVACHLTIVLYLFRSCYILQLIKCQNMGHYIFWWLVYRKNKKINKYLIISILGISCFNYKYIGYFLFWDYFFYFDC